MNQLNKKVLLIIMDGVGHSTNKLGNAVVNARTPNLDYLKQNFPYTFINASGIDVGLPENQMGNSEVGHLNIGAGRIVYTGLSLISNEINNGNFANNPAFLQAINHVKKFHSKLHIMGLVSNGGVHSSLQHILALLKLASQHQISTVLHCFSDGRDVDPKAFKQDLKSIIPLLDEYHIKLGMISGRYYAMDRDHR